METVALFLNGSCEFVHCGSGGGLSIIVVGGRGSVFLVR